MIDIGKIKPGDEVVLKLKVQDFTLKLGGTLLGAPPRVYMETRPTRIGPVEIVEHIPAPPEFKIGDKVVFYINTDLYPYPFRYLRVQNIERNEGVIVGLFENYAWIVSPKLESPTSFRLNVIEHISA